MLGHLSESQSTHAGGQASAWMNVVNTIAAALSSQLKYVIKALHQCAAQSQGIKQTAAFEAAYDSAFQQLQPSFKTVMDLPGADMTSSASPCSSAGSGGSMRSILDAVSNTLEHPTSVSAAKLHDVLSACIEDLSTWKRSVLSTLDGSGHPLTAVQEFAGGLPVRVLVNGRFEADCLDSNDLVELFCCCSDAAHYCRMAMLSA